MPRQRINVEKVRYPFIRDGVVNEARFLENMNTFILKEVNSVFDEGWDLRDFLGKGGRKQSWTNIARWNYCLNNFEKEITWIDFREKSGKGEFRKRQLQAICAMNIKKVTGSNVANSKNIQTIAREDSVYLKKQLDIYSKSRYVICCGTPTGMLLRTQILKFPGKWDITNRGIYYKPIDDTVYINFFHPSARIDDCVLFYALQDAVREIRTR